MKTTTEPRIEVGVEVTFSAGSAGFPTHERSGIVTARKWSFISGWHYDVQVDGEGVWSVTEAMLR